MIHMNMEMLYLYEMRFHGLVFKMAFIKVSFFQVSAAQIKLYISFFLHHKSLVQEHKYVNEIGLALN